MMPQRTAVVLAVVLMTVGCAKPWNTVNTALEAAAVAAAETDELCAGSMGGDHEAARARVVAEAQTALNTWEECSACEGSDCAPCGDRPTVASFMESYLEELARWEAVTLALEELREALIIAQVGTGIWRDTQEVPGDWSTICAGLETTRSAVIRAIEATGVDVPEQYERMSEYLEPACNLVAAAVGGD
jgi:hypothetical protein